MTEDDTHNNAGSDLTEELTLRWTQAQPIVTSYITSIVRDFNNVEDVVQEVAVAVARGYADSDRSRPFVPWALGIARHKIADYQRKHFRNKQVFDTDLLEKIEQGHKDIEPESQEIRHALDICLGRLQDRGRMLIQLRYGHNLRPAQIAERVGMTANAVGVVLHRVRKALGECIQDRVAQEGGSP